MDPLAAASDVTVVSHVWYRRGSQPLTQAVVTSDRSWAHLHDETNTVRLQTMKKNFSGGLTKQVMGVQKRFSGGGGINAFFLFSINKSWP